jgi:plastocyanin
MKSPMLLAIVVALLGACAPAEDATPDAAPGAEVTVAGFAFQPETLTAAQGATVTWTNEDDVPHTATATDGTFDVSLSPGASGSHRFDEPGTYAYACSLHPQMTGQITVS